MKAIYKSAALLFGAMSLFSSCEDFLTRDPMDSPLLEDYLNSDAKLDEYTRNVRGPLSWNGYDDKFSWCVGELYSGNVYHIFGDEGQFHYMNFSPTNAHIYNAYTSLYGVIAKCNHIINDVPAIAQKNGLSEAMINKVVGEAKMYRGMAYFYLAEYWGASPIVLHNADVITNGWAPEVTKADRKTLYTLIEKDWKEAYDLLPEEQSNDCRVWKASASGMLTKLYVTMASCQADLNEPGSYKCDDPNAYYDKAIVEGKKTLELCKYYLEHGYEAYDAMFQPGTTSNEILFALLFEQGVYAQGCSRQIQFARSKYLAAGGNAYGGEKGLTTTLFDSYDKKNDFRLKSTSYYFGADDDYSDAKTKEDLKNGTGHYYMLIDAPENGSNPTPNKYYYFLNPNKSLTKAERDKYYGSEPNSAIFNHCRKFVYSVYPQNSEFSIDLTIPLLRVADVYLLLAEAEMGKEAKDVTASTTAGIEYVNTVRERAGLSKIDKIAFCEEDTMAGNGNVAFATIDDPDGNPVEIEASCDKYYPTYDLMLERRHEFALECQNWFDIKRLYYRDPEAAKLYIKTQDRGFVYGEKFGSEIAAPQKRADFQRQRLVNALSIKAHEINETYPIQAAEGTIEIDKLQFALPTPASVSNTGGFGTVNNYVDQILDGSYKY